MWLKFPGFEYYEYNTKSLDVRSLPRDKVYIQLGKERKRHYKGTVLKWHVKEDGNEVVRLVKPNGAVLTYSKRQVKKICGVKNEI